MCKVSQGMRILLWEIYYDLIMKLMTRKVKLYLILEKIDTGTMHDSWFSNKSVLHIRSDQSLSRVRLFATP